MHDEPVRSHELHNVTFEDIQAAADLLYGNSHRTPVHHARSLDAEAGMSVWLKCESFQRGGAFKFRGAYNKIATLPVEQRMRGVIAFSSGNHAQAVALVAGIFGIPAVICMPTDAPSVKVAATRGYGAEIVRYDRLTQDREALARQLAEERGLTLVPPYNDPAIIAGQGTAALELLDDAPELDVIAAPVGGGGLIAGSAIAAHARQPGIKIVGVETEAANHAYLALQRGERVTIPPPDTIADGIRTAALGTLTWPIIQREVAEIVLVSEEEVKAAMRFLVQRLKLVVEPTGAVAVAAALSGKLRRFGGPAVTGSPSAGSPSAGPVGARAGVIVSGGNVAPEVLCAVLNEGQGEGA